MATAFGDLADLKTPWTHGHSSGVAKLACSAARGAGLDAKTVADLEVSALLADLGRVAVSNAIWEKPGPLTAAEWEQARMHAYHSERILADVERARADGTLRGHAPRAPGRIRLPPRLQGARAAAGGRGSSRPRMPSTR